VCELLLSGRAQGRPGVDHGLRRVAALGKTLHGKTAPPAVLLLVVSDGLVDPGSGRRRSPWQTNDGCIHLAAHVLPGSVEVNQQSQDRREFFSAPV
jgi:hypothetical protein